MATDRMAGGSLIVWGHGESWIVHWHDGIAIRWASQWFRCRNRAKVHRDRLEAMAKAGKAPWQKHQGGGGNG